MKTTGYFLMQRGDMKIANYSKTSALIPQSSCYKFSNNLLRVLKTEAPNGRFVQNIGVFWSSSSSLILASFSSVSGNPLPATDFISYVDR